MNAYERISELAYRAEAAAEDAKAFGRAADEADRRAEARAYRRCLPLIALGQTRPRVTQ